MKALINGKEVEVIYIEYGYNNIPHQVFTIETETGYSKSWDFFCNNGQKNDIRFYNAGSGYNKNEKIQAPNWVDANKGKYWIANEVKLKGKSNGIKLEKPIRVKGYFKSSSINPFKIAEETNSREYCEECGYESTEFCYKHKYEDSKGIARWIHNDEYAE